MIQFIQLINKFFFIRTLELLKTYLTERPSSGAEGDSKVTIDFLMEKTENAISRGANEL